MATVATTTCSIRVPELPTPVDLSIDYPSSLQLRVRGSLTGTGSYTYDPEFRDELTDVDGDDVTLNNVLLRLAM
jgi:hypothetical protein